MDDALSERFSSPVPEYSDSVTAFADFLRKGSVAGDARAFMMPPYTWPSHWWIAGGSPVPEPWVKPTEDELRAHLLKSWTEPEVDAYMVRRAALEAERAARVLWEASWRGRIVLGYRRVSREVVERVGESWRVLRHGIRDEDEY